MIPESSSGPSPWWVQHGYLVGKELGEGLWLCVARMIFTWRVMVCTEDSVYEHYCYAELEPALEAFWRWDGRGENPVGGWTRHHS